MHHIEINKDLLTWVKWEKVKAYAESKTTESIVAYPSSVEECKKIIEFSIKNKLTICSRGAGYSFADMILNHKNIVLDVSRMNNISKLDQKTGEIIVEPGVKLGDILMLSLKYNLTLCACPGGALVSVGGAISNNVHGKDSWKDGNFGNHINELKLLTANGKIVVINKMNNQSLFQAVVSGMGLLGIIIEATIQLKKIPSPFLEISTVPVKNIDHLISKIEESKEKYDFIVTWADAFAGKSSLGRGYVSRSRWIESKNVISNHRLKNSLKLSKKIYDVFPTDISWTLLRYFYGKNFVKLLNAALYAKKNISNLISTNKNKIMLFSEYTFMFRKLPGFTQLFRPYGFAHCQPMIPRSHGSEGVAEVLKMSKRFGYEPLICGLKAHGSDNNMLSYSGDGYSIGIDIHLKNVNKNNLEKFVRNLFEYTINCGGITYLAKDELLPRDLFEKMYPRYTDFLKVKKKLDPNALFASDMYRRLLQPH